jgi:hypothetical protein
MTAEHPQGDEPLIPMPALSLPARRQPRFVRDRTSVISPGSSPPELRSGGDVGTGSLLDEAQVVMGWRPRVVGPVARLLDGQGAFEGRAADSSPSRCASRRADRVVACGVQRGRDLGGFCSLSRARRRSNLWGG